jgi:glyoxylate carboligase
MAAFMASAYAKFSKNLGVCIATSGLGASHLITGLYDARMDHQPVLAIVGQQASNALGGQYQQELDLVSMFKDVAGAYVSLVIGSSLNAGFISGSPRYNYGKENFKVPAAVIENRENSER